MGVCGVSHAANQRAHGEVASPPTDCSCPVFTFNPFNFFPLHFLFEGARGALFEDSERQER